MKYRLFPVLFLLICLIGLVQAASPIIHSISASALTAQSGELVYFNAIATDEDNDLADYHWDFHDGSQADIKSPTHSFTLTPGQIVDTFTVTLTVSDAEGNQATDSIEVRVEKGFFVIKVLEPQSGQSFAKGELLKMKIRLEDPEGNALGSHLAYFVRAEVNGAVIDLATSGELGVFEADWQADYALNSQVDVTFSASVLVEDAPRFAGAVTPVSFSPAAISAEAFFKPEALTEGARLESIELHLYYPDGSPVLAANITAFLDGQELNFSRSNDYFMAAVGERLTAADLPELKVDVVDDFGNSLTGFSKRVELAEASPNGEPPAERKPADGVTDDTVTLIALAVVVIIVLLVLVVVAGFILKKKPKFELKEFKPVPGLGEELPKRLRKMAEKKVLTEIDIDVAIARIKKSVKPSKKVSPTEKMKALTKKVKEVTLREKVAAEAAANFESLSPADKKKVNEMIDLLKPYKNKYTFNEIENAAMAEGYNATLAAVIAKKLKKKE
jgi:PKD repeat protein